MILGSVVCLMIGACAQPKQLGTTATPATAPQRLARVADSSGIIWTRPVWPVNVPLYVWVTPGPVMDAKSHQLRLKADFPDAPGINAYARGEGIACILPDPDMTWTDYNSHAGIPRAPRDAVNFSLAISSPEGSDPKARPKPTGPLKLPVQIKGTVEDILTGVPLPDLDEALVTQLNAQLYRRGWHSGGSPRLWLGVYTNCEGALYTQSPGICHVLARHPDTTFAVRLEVTNDGVVVASSAAWWRGERGSVTPYDGMLTLDVLQATLTSLRIDGKWCLHVKSDPVMALRDFQSNRYWLGDVIVPLRVTDDSEWKPPNKDER